MSKFNLFGLRKEKVVEKATKVEATREVEDYENQCEQILAVLKGGHSISPIWAEDNLNCHRLSARIHDLRKDGYNIKTTMGYSKTKVKGKTIVHPYAIYTLEENE